MPVEMVKKVEMNIQNDVSLHPNHIKQIPYTELLTLYENMLKLVLAELPYDEDEFFRIQNELIKRNIDLL